MSRGDARTVVLAREFDPESEFKEVVFEDVEQAVAHCRVLELGTRWEAFLSGG